MSVSTLIEPDLAVGRPALQSRGAPRPRPARVCFLIDELTTAGTETQLLALIHHLERGRVQPYLCLLRGQSTSSRRLEPTSCPVLRLGVGSLRSPATLAKVWNLVRFLRQQSIDVLQVYFPESTYIGLLVGRLAGVRHLVRTRNNLGYWMTSPHRFLGRLYKHFSQVTVANCEACRQAVLCDEGLSPEQVVVLENGVDLERFTLNAPRPNRQGRRVGVVANLRPVKGLDLFIRAAATLASSHLDVTFHVAGEGPARPVLEQLVHECGLVGRVSLLGSVADIPNFLAGLDVAVLPSRSEGLSNGLLEYMAAGRALVATAVGGNTRLIEDGVNGLLVPHEDPMRLGAAIGRLLDDEELAARLGAAARRHVEEGYGRQAMVRRFEDFYEQLLKGRTVDG
jgi:glycosyltransferase involved in cell wall biosynthesis